jgi:hypothetical protein
VPGVPDIVGGGGGGAFATSIPNAGSEALSEPLLTLMMIPG